VRGDYEKELQTYDLLYQATTTFEFAKPIGYAEWSAAKYAKIIGKGIRSILDPNDTTIFVLLLKYVAAKPLSEISASPEIAAEALNMLARLHELGVVHGDISRDNILVMDSQDGKTPTVVWIDFAASWRFASLQQVAWEMELAADYFEQWVLVYSGKLG
jgi:RIO-like serine/threonine protein kinase